ncbi:helix-turn-helix domain-containing protein [Parachryseolinea silvisoli]|uniref:helix-turn-helix domain-containing protein n=1 Tax=Parachryseolinea silvisoli TaxID=2873601 RepID=UPI002265D1A4|nr:helix-turn-helix domain-containing protein [Parachryseolinea silvisoli]MCD9015460.1 helix-turn-helix domain-containing protein [Parachryseolinea silvisoli]
MEPEHDVDNTLLERLRREIDNNLTNDQFSVEELAKNMGMSRSQLHRKLILATGQSVSQFIREYRLQLGMTLLKAGTLTAAEVADRIGFGSPTYFSKCFNEYYGYPPGEVKNKLGKIPSESDRATTVNRSGTRLPTRKPLLLKIILAGVVLLVIGMIYFNDTGRNGVAADRNDKSIAILPFKNLSEDRRNEYFSEGVIEAIRTSLSQIRELRVISRTSVEQYRESAKSAREIAQELGVSALLEGSIQRSENEIRIDVRLVDGITQEQVWAKSYDHELKDVFAIQAEIAQQVADELHTKLSPEEKSKLSKTDTDNPKAYDLYLKGVYEYRTYTNKGTHHAIGLFTQAIALDSNYARAYAFLANSYIGLATIFGAELSALEGLRKGKPLIDKALALDPDLDEAQMLMGFYKLYHDWDFEGAEAAYKEAITSDHPDALALYIDYLNFTLRHQEAMAFAEHLNVKDPYYPNSRIILSYVYNNRLDEALEFSESRLKMFNNYSTLDSHGFLLLRLKRYNEAIVYFNKAIAFEGIRYPRMLGWMGAAYAQSGERQKAVEIINELKQRLARNEKGSIAFFIAVIYSALNEKRPALLWLKTAYDSHDMEMPWLLTEPQFYTLHEEPEFQQLAKQVGFK